MGSLRETLDRITKQLGVLTVSQRLALGLGAALIFVSMLWLMQWSTKPELVSLVTYDFSFDELSAAEKALEANGILYESTGQRILVRSADRHNAQRLLYEADALPQGKIFDMATVVNGDNPFQSPDARRFEQNYAKGNELAQIMETSPQVKKASVIIQPATKRRLGGESDLPKASITLTLASGLAMSRQKVKWAADLVAGAVSGLKPWNVSVTDASSMRSFRVPHPDDAAGADLFAEIKQREAHFQSKIIDKLGDIPGLRASVTVALDTSKSIRQIEKFHKPEPKSEITESSEKSTAQQPSEPGVQANLGQAVTAGAQGGRDETNKTETEFYPPNRKEVETIEQPAGETRRVTAAIGIPRSFVVSVFQARFADRKEAPKDSDKDFLLVRDEQIDRVRQSVEKIIQAESPDDVIVDVYPDMTWSPEGGDFATTPMTTVNAPTHSGGQDMVDLLRAYAPQGGLALLALMSLGMMMRVVRKSSERATSAESVADISGDGDVLFEEGVQPVGQAPTSEGFLVGRELGEDAIRAEELNAEVAKMVQDDPEGAAQILGRWMEDKG